MKNRSNPLHPEWLRCWEKMKTLMFSLTSTEHRHCLRDIVTAARERRKMEDSVQLLRLETIAMQGCNQFLSL